MFSHSSIFSDHLQGKPLFQKKIAILKGPFGFWTFLKCPFFEKSPPDLKTTFLYFFPNNFEMKYKTSQN